MDENSKAPFMKPALIYGAIMGCIGILVSVLMYIFNVMFESWVSIVSIVVTIVVMVFLLRAYRNEYLGGFASYGKLLLMSVMIGLFSGILTSVYTYLLYTVIDPELVQKSLTITESKLLENPKIPEGMIDTIMERTERNLQPVRMMLVGIISSPILSGIFGLIISIFLKKEVDNPLNDAV